MDENIDATLDSKAIGRRVRHQRETLNLSREQLAEKINISSKFCADIENGARGMSINTMMRISRALKISTDYVVFGSDFKSEVATDENSVLIESILDNLRCCNRQQLGRVGEVVRIITEPYRGE